MKELFIEPAKQLIKERRIIIALTLLLVLTLGFTLYVAFNIHPSDLKIVTHYSAFGSTNFYRDAWFYLLGFVVFGILVFISHTLIALRLLAAKGSEIALFFVWVSIAVLFIAMAITYQVLKVAALI